MSIEQEMINDDLARDRAEVKHTEFEAKCADMLSYIWTDECEMLEVLDEVRNSDAWLPEFGALMAKKDYREAGLAILAIIVTKAKERAETLVEDAE